jgi:phospholipid/cholesterol/gamma-HCH transport system substrate-binding protein
MPTTAQINWAKFRIISVVIPALIILTLLFYLLTGGTLLQPKTTLYLYVPDSTGIGSGSAVRVNGIDVGTVDRVALSGDTRPDRIVRVSMTVPVQWLATIPANSYAQLSTETLIGDKFVDITTGSSRSPIRPNSEILYKEKPDVLQRLDLQQFRQQLQSVESDITDIEQGRGVVGEFVQGTGMYDEWRKLLRGSQKAIDAIAARNGKLGSVVYTDREYQALSGLIRNLDQSLARLQSGQGDFGRLLRDDQQYQQLSASLGDLRRSIADVEASPWLQSAEVYNDFSRQLSGLIRTVDDFNASPPMETSQVYDTLNGMTRELQKNLQDFRMNPQKYLRLKF